MADVGQLLLAALAQSLVDLGWKVVLTKFLEAVVVEFLSVRLWVEFSVDV